MDRRHTLLGLALALAACAPVPAPSPVPTPKLLSLPTATPTVLAALAETSAAAGAQTPATTPVIIASPTATPTPVTHVVAAGETMLGIAINFGVSLTALQAANPTVEARFLSIGTVLVIPPPEGGFAVAATNLAPPPPAPVTFSQPVCYPQTSSGLYCLVEARNPNDAPLENVSARIILAGADGLPFASQTAFSALDLVPAGAAVPLAALFQPAPAQPPAATGVEPVSAILVSEPVSAAQAVLLDVAATPGAILGGRWSVSGSVHNPSALPLTAAWVVLSVYDSNGRLTGFRKLALANGLASDETRAFSINSDALAGPVVRGVVLAEGRP
jgi:LysM repeat protein